MMGCSSVEDGDERIGCQEAPLNHVRLPSKMNTRAVFSGVYARQGRIRSKMEVTGQ